MLNPNIYVSYITNLFEGLTYSDYFADWGPLVDVVGFCFLNLGSKYQPQDEFVQWIQNGPEPIYIGFGSMVW
jgi:UDP:flavonoid glycosyltransferase YjiC (YdhE family)